MLCLPVCAELPVVKNLRTRLLALRLLETILLSPSATSDLRENLQFGPSELSQIVDTLLSDMAAAMWSSPLPEAVEAVSHEKRQMEASIDELSASEQAGVGGPAVVSCCGSTDIADVAFDVDKMLNCTVENGQMLIHGAGGRGYGLAGIPISSGCYQWKVTHSRYRPFS